MSGPPVTLADLLSGMNEDACRGCPPDRVCAWACRQGWGVTDGAYAALLGGSMDEPLADVESVERLLCECYN